MSKPKTEADLIKYICEKRKITEDEFKKMTHELQKINPDAKIIGLGNGRNGAKNFKVDCGKCDKTHDFMMETILDGNTRCKTNNTKRKVKTTYTIDMVTEIAKKRDILALNDTYKNVRENMSWQCLICSNKWGATWNNIHNHGSGCPKCVSYYNEEKTRLMLEILCGFKLPKDSSVKFLCFDTRCIELDGYNVKEKVAFEYNGPV
jgi:hypothetical protein